MTHTYLVNPDTKGAWRCPDALVDLYVKKRGWKVAPDPEAAEDIPPAPAPVLETEEPTAFDPTGKKVKDVLAYIDPLRESHPGEVARVLLLERQGEQRPTILGTADADETKEK
jgi:hypothetical protein